MAGKYFELASYPTLASSKSCEVEVSHKKWKTDYQVLLKYAPLVLYGQEAEVRTLLVHTLYLNKSKQANVVVVDLIKRR